MTSASPNQKRALILIRFAYLLALFFGFLVAIELMSKSIGSLADVGMLGGGEKGELFTGVSNPFAGLALGVLFTVLVQSSSTTTATIVAVVASGALTVEQAVPMVMGANIGTTITNTLVAIGHVRRSVEFRRAFSAATVHDFFNLMAVSALLPLELLTGFLSKTASKLSGVLAGGGGAEYESPIKDSIKGARGWLVDLLEATGLEGRALGVTTLVLGIGLTILCLLQITRIMRQTLSGRIERGLNKALGGSGFVGIGFGAGTTMAVQSSSITTSLLVPMCAAGVMSLEAAFPVMLGANIGTTVTALLASLAQENPAALTIAIVHVLFNLIAVAAFFFVPGLRRIPPRLARRLAVQAARNRIWVLAYVGGMFVALPLAGWFLWGVSSS